LLGVDQHSDSCLPFELYPVKAPSFFETENLKSILRNLPLDGLALMLQIA